MPPSKNRNIGETWYERSNCGADRMMVMTEDGPKEIVMEKPVNACGEHTMPTHVHLHRSPDGFLHRCYHKCRSIFTWQFFAGLTLSFPIEHALWTKVTPFVQIAEFLGLGIGHH